MAAPKEGSWGSRMESCPRMKRFRRPRRCPAGLVGGWSSEAIRLPAFVPREGMRRLRTRLWRAKRFTMVKRWGFYLPLGLHGRSEGDEDPEELQGPQSFVKSCFTEQNSGKWELQDCEDSLALQTFRWPIGFVTTGFVRGSSKPVAEAFCEARLLAMLRGQQSCDAQTAEAEIFVFVRNMRSTAYRPALTTIVLERQNDGLEFM
ncbi:Ribonucleases P MRP protein subunit POP1 containing protein [Musa troglodytarum]|uniref:Ribonucleases P MRP protein subunit POP1 containing protein n=1 Tax=Musa troglodytarum TaxID=320322 RepID=A0A9E7F007_9LILI|nr:Ribonucleases P MRP protein subunit POP1 containing protein [Musa troglodytarum]